MNGPVVSLTGREGILNIVYHNGEPNAFDQNLAMDIIHMKSIFINIF